MGISMSNDKDFGATDCCVIGWFREPVGKNKGRASPIPICQICLVLLDLSPIENQLCDYCGEVEFCNQD